MLIQWVLLHQQSSPLLARGQSTRAIYIAHFPFQCSAQLKYPHVLLPNFECLYVALIQRKWRYITAEDVGTTVADMDIIYEETDYVTGISPAFGSSTMQSFNCPR